MDDDCIPFASLPGTSALQRAFLEGAASPHAELLQHWYAVNSFSSRWMAAAPELSSQHRDTLAELLLPQAAVFGSSEGAVANIEKLRNGAAAVVTGQQVGLFGGPLLTLLKAATAVRQASEATRRSGREHVPVFWLASEDHDLAEVDQVSLPAKAKTAILSGPLLAAQPEKLSLGLQTKAPVAVGSIELRADNVGLERVLEQVSALLDYAPVCDWLREFYAPGATLASAFGKLLSKVFAHHGLIVMDAASRGFHALGATALRAAIEHAEELEAALLERSKQIEAAGFHAQVLVSAGHSLLFLIEETTGARLPLRRNEDGAWRAGALTFTTAELLQILEREPERLSPNALLRPVFQDCLLPTAAYVGGPAEIAYFAQSSVIYERVLGTTTAVLPRLSATLIEPDIAEAMQRDEVSLLQVIEAKTADELALRLGARAMPIEGKRKIAAAGNAMDAELTALTEYMGAMSADLGRAAGVSASKMRYQMNRLRRMAARFETQKQDSLKKHAAAMSLQLYPQAHLQERLLAGVWFLARYGEGLADVLVEHAGQPGECHRIIRL
jgi:bacillithiol biosynthesis cysteine-adding enzyme BshC